MLHNSDIEKYIQQHIDAKFVMPKNLTFYEFSPKQTYTVGTKFYLLGDFTYSRTSDIGKVKNAKTMFWNSRSHRIKFHENEILLDKHKKLVWNSDNAVHCGKNIMRIRDNKGKIRKYRVGFIYFSNLKSARLYCEYN